MMAIAAVVVLYVFDMSPLPSLFEGGNPKAFSSSAPKTSPVKSMDDYIVLQKGFLLESNASAFLTRKRAPLLGGDYLYLITCPNQACSQQKLLQADKVREGVASSKFDQFVFLAEDGAKLYYINTADNVVYHGSLTLQCGQRADDPKPELKLRSVGGRTAYLYYIGQDCLKAKFGKAEFDLTSLELKQPTTDVLRLQFAATGQLASLQLESGSDAQGNRLK